MLDTGGGDVTQHLQEPGGEGRVDNVVVGVVGLTCVSPHLAVLLYSWLGQPWTCSDSRDVKPTLPCVDQVLTRWTGSQTDSVHLGAHHSQLVTPPHAPVQRLSVI